ncbi:MAG: S-methyl-5'-thioadenosine phosphorylase [archaeon]
MQAEIGIIGGTGVYSSELLKNVEEIKVYTPYGAPSDLIRVGDFKGRKIAFLFRHNQNHIIPPHKINFRANIWALKNLGVSRVLATAATGSLKDDYKSGEVVIPDQFVDFSKKVHTFYNGGQFYHVSLADPFCSELRKLLVESTKNLRIPMHEKGIYLKIDGPQFSTRAASNMYRQFADLIGMTCVPEAILCRELEMCFGIIATITDYDVWADKPVNFEEIKKVMNKNLENTKKILEETITKMPKERKCECKNSLEGAKA